MTFNPGGNGVQRLGSKSWARAWSSGARNTHKTIKLELIATVRFMAFRQRIYGWLSQ
jgi:hypothetical protein